ncbi:MAG: tetratricopeptide repeat protein [Lentisphaeria bacterium]|nr:tetratricopeptide repeat protein [Lentisphaeria bacterium]
MRNRISLLAILALLTVPGAAGFAQSGAVRRDMAYSRELNALGLYDFSTRFLTERLAENKSKDMANFYRVQLAETYLASGKNDEAQKIIDGIPKTDPAYYQSLGTLGVYHYMKKDNQKALKPLEELYNHLKRNKIDPSDFERPLTALLNIYYQEGRENDASALMDWTRGNVSDKRASSYTKAVMQLSTAENNRRAELREKAAFQRRISDLMKDKSKQTDLTRLQKRIADLTKSVVDNPGNTNNQRARIDAYKELGGILGMDLDRIMRIDEMELARKKTSGEVKHRDKWSSGDKDRLRRVDPNDWQTAVLAAAVDFHDIQWGGQDMLTAYATAQIIRCFYLLGEYEEAGEEVRRYPDLFEASDEALEKDGKKSESPAADAKFWTGRSYLALAEQAEAAAAEAKAKGDSRKEADLKKQAVTYYRRAFKYLGKLVKYYPQFKDAPAAYKDFKQATENAMAIDPDKRSTYQSEFSKVKAPEMSDQSTLVSAWAEQNYASKQYNLVVEELLPILQRMASRYTPGLSELVNRLVLSYAYMGDSTSAVVLGSYAALLPKDDFVTTALLNAGHVLWKQAAEAASSDPAKAAQLKGDALTLYRLLLEIDMLNPYAGVVSLRMAREHLNAASAIGKRLNASSDSAERIALKKQWQAEVNDAAAAYKVIMENFGNNPELTDEAYMKYADCLAMQDDYEGAANALRKFIAFGPSSLKVTAVVQEIIPEMLSREADRLAEQATSIREEAAGDSALIEKADKLKAQAAAIYDEAVEGILELRRDIAEGGKYASVANTPEVQKVVRRADSLLPWLYDGAGKWDKAISEFETFVRKHPDDPLASAYLMRIGIIHMNMGRDSEAQKILTTLGIRYPESAEAKNAQYVLARTLYTAGNYAEALNIFERLFSGNQDQAKNLSVTNLRWIASTLPQCPDESLSKRAAAIALNVCERLIMAVQDPKLDDWFSEERAAELKSDRTAAEIAVSRLKQRLYLDAGRAAAKNGQFDKAVEELEKIELLEKDSPYFYDMHFALAEVRELQGRAEEARAELAKISVRANQTANFELYNKAQVLTGESFLKSCAVNKAYACFSIIAATAFPEDEDEDAASETPEPEAGAEPEAQADGQSSAAADEEADPAAMQWIEQAIYRTAYTAALLGNTEERDRMVGKYRRHFPDGRYAAEIGALPESQAQ